MPTRSTLIRGLKRAVLNHVPAADRADARLLLSTLEDQYAALMSTTASAAYEEGFAAAREKYQPEAIKQDAFQVGYRDGYSAALAKIGEPARARVDDDETAEPLKLPVC